MHKLNLASFSLKRTCLDICQLFTRILMGRAFAVTYVMWNSLTNLIWTDILPQRIVLRIWPINVKIVKLGLFLLRNWKFIRLKIVLKNTSVEFALLSSSPKLVIRIMLIVIKGHFKVRNQVKSGSISRWFFFWNKVFQTLFHTIFYFEVVLKLTCSTGIFGPSIVSSLCPIIDMN